MPSPQRLCFICQNMERGGLQWRARSSFEKAHGEAPPRLQVIGFNVCAPKLAEAREGLEIMNASSDHNEAPASHDLLSFENKPKPSASSPRSALQQLLLNQSLPSTSSPSSNHSLPHGVLLLPPSTSSELLTPAISSPSPNHNLTSGLLLQPAISPPAANHNWTINLSKLGHTPSSGHLKSLLQSENASSDNQHSRISLFSSLGQSPCASSSSSSGNQSMKGGSVSVNVQMINRLNPKPSQAPIKENYEAFFRIKQKTDDEACYIEEKKKFNNGNDAKAHEISEKEVINEFPYVAKSQKSSGFLDNEHPSADNCQKSSFKVVQQSTEHSFGNEKGRKGSRIEEKSKKSTLFMFVVSSPAPEFHDHHHHGENNMSKDMDFLSSCHLCRCFLRQGEDVFMYSGDKAFCSMECRYQQIVIDERKERCPPPVIRSGASQVYQHTSIATATTHHPIMINKAHFIKTAAAA